MVAPTKLKLMFKFMNIRNRPKLIARDGNPR